MSVTITEAIGRGQASYLPRLVIGLALGLVVTLFLFWFMQFMIETADRSLDEGGRGSMVDFVRVQRDETIQRRQLKPKKPPPPEAPPQQPPTPKLDNLDPSAEKISISAVPVTTDIEMTGGFSLGVGEGDYLPIVGVVRTVSYGDLGEAPQPAVFSNISHSWDSASILLVRTAGDPLSMLPVVRDVMRDIDPNFSPSDTRTFTSLISFKLMPAKIAAGLCILFGALALGLAMIGLYGVMAYMVAQRTHEIGIRMAVGAEKSDVLKLVMRQGLILTGIGLGIGLAIALGFAQALKSMLYDVSPADPVTFIGIALLLIVVAALATLIPARRAMKVDPMVALRYE